MLTRPADLIASACCTGWQVDASNGSDGLAAAFHVIQWVAHGLPRPPARETVGSVSLFVSLYEELRRVCPGV